jgi:ABC-type nitrate/sulfonate/bicarbonate transport system permease component
MLVAWQVLASARVLPAYLVSPTLIVGELGKLMADGSLFEHSLVSLYRSLVGLLLSIIFGVGLGLLAGVSKKAASFFEPLVSLTYPVPKITLLPILLVWFGVTDTSKILLIAVSCFYPCFLAAFYGVRTVNPLWVWAAGSMGASRTRIFLGVVLPAAFPMVFAGVRVALALSFILMFASEMIGSSNRVGLGFLIIVADAGGRFDQVFAAVTAIAVIGFGSDRLLLWLRSRLMPWYGVSR